MILRYLRQFWAASRLLTFTGVIMLGGLAACAIGLAIDPRVVTGAPAWLKPAKFCFSTALYAFSIAWVFTQLESVPKLARVAGALIAWTLNIEVILIAVQAGRGVASHFNVGTRLDAAIFTVMGTAIGVLWLSSIAIAVTLFRSHFGDRTWGWALRWGMLVSVLGASVGGLMTVPTHDQLARAHGGGGMPMSGRHTVGAPDGGAGLLVTGWSRQHGDLRISHFFGLHALQILPLLGWALIRSRKRNSEALIHIAAAGYAGFCLILLTQALRGQALFHPDGVTGLSLLLWAAAIGSAWLLTEMRSIATVSRCRPYPSGGISYPPSSGQVG